MYWVVIDVLVCVNVVNSLGWFFCVIFMFVLYMLKWSCCVFVFILFNDVCSFICFFLVNLIVLFNKLLRIWLILCGFEFIFMGGRFVVLIRSCSFLEVVLMVKILVIDLISVSGLKYWLLILSLFVLILDKLRMLLISILRLL